MQEFWTEDLDPVIATDATGSARLTAHVTVSGIGGEAVHAAIRLCGELCATTTPAVTDEVERLLALGVGDVRFDLHDLRLCTSTGIDLWVEAAARVLPRGGDVRLVGAYGVVRRALDAVGVDDSATVRPLGE
ncbi:MAG TPA: STAS domain-containing protein [Acidimicrobiales bacterium]|nr:STAS domain-containing protein [Acidimicrobiales bacterium]